MEEIEIRNLDIDYRNLKNRCQFKKYLKSLKLFNFKEELFKFDIKDINDLHRTFPNLEALHFEYCELKDMFMSKILKNLQNLSNFFFIKKFFQ